MSMVPTLLSVRDLSKSYGGVHAVRMCSSCAPVKFLA